MQHLDLFTVRVMTLMTVVISGLATLCAWKINQTVKGMKLFALGMLAMGFGSVVGLFGDALPANLTAIAGTAFRFGGMIGLVQGLRAFRGFRPLNRNLVIALSAIVSAPYFYFLYARDPESARLGILSCALSFLAVDAARSMLRQVPARDRSTLWPIGGIFALISAPLALRALVGLSGAVNASPIPPLSVEIAWTICANAAFIICAFGMLLASNSHLRHEAEDLALFDSLTNLPNRRYFQDRLLKAEQNAESTGRKFGVIYLDLDGFKFVNDTLGHDAGDRLLRNLSTAMSAIVGPEDCLARVGGDEFVVLVEDLEDSAELTELAGRLNAAIARASVSGKPATRMRASCGIAVFPDNGRSAHDVMREADFEMFHAKRQHRLATQSASA